LEACEGFVRSKEERVSVRIVVSFKALPGKGGELAEAFKPVMQITHEERGCEQYELFQAVADPDSMVLLERWTSRGDLDVHLQAMQSRGVSPMAPFRADGMPVAEQYQWSISG
jgi:quinol monooxygenase YgiN